MPKFGLISQQRLATCHEDLQRVMNEVIKWYDISIICGHRGEAEQNRAYETGHSKLRWPNSKHNRLPSLAVDIAPWPIDWNDHKRFWYMGGLVMGVAAKMGIKIDWGGNWISFIDLPHFELQEA